MGTGDSQDADSTEIELFWRLRSYEAFKKNDSRVSGKGNQVDGDYICPDIILREQVSATTSSQSTKNELNNF